MWTRTDLVRLQLYGVYSIQVEIPVFAPFAANRLPVLHLTSCTYPNSFGHAFPTTRFRKTKKEFYNSKLTTPMTGEKITTRMSCQNIMEDKNTIGRISSTPTVRRSVSRRTHIESHPNGKKFGENSKINFGAAKAFEVKNEHFALICTYIRLRTEKKDSFGYGQSNRIIRQPNQFKTLKMPLPKGWEITPITHGDITRINKRTSN